jgi:predicted metal-dependent hydrolase
MKTSDRTYYKRMVTTMLNKFEAEYGKRPAVSIRISPSHSYSSGRTKTSWFGTSVTCTFGANRQDAKHVFAHELAHVLTPGAAHGPRFYVKFKELIKFYNLSVTYAIKREGNYKPRNSKMLRKRKVTA